MFLPPTPTTTTYDTPGCISATCGPNNLPCLLCYYADPVLSPPSLPPPPPPPHPSSASHLAPFLIATVCILGISFLFLTTCTVLLRCRFSSYRRRRTPPPPSPPAASVDHHIWNIATVGLTQSVIDSITVIKYKKLEGLLSDGSDCIVCLSEFEDGEDLRLLPKCSHAFHVNCIDNWLRSHINCPICRAPVVKEGSPTSGDGVLDSVMSVGSIGVDIASGSGNNDEAGELRLSIEGIKIPEILRKNREQLRIFSDLGENYRFRMEEEAEETVRRSFSFSVVDASLILREVGKENEGGCSSSGNDGGGGGVKEKKMGVEKVSNKRGSSMSGLLMKSSSIGRLQKGPVSMKRSISSSGKLFSFRRTRSQASSILPL